MSRDLELLESTMLIHVAPLPGYPSHLLSPANSCCFLGPSLSVSSYLKPALTSLIPPPSVYSVELPVAASLFLMAPCMYLFYIA